MKLNNTLIAFLFFASSYAQNNLIHNASFEDKDNGNCSSNPDCYPYGQAQVSRLQVWTDASQIKTCSGNPVYLHSPDWFYANGGSYYRLNKINGPVIQARTGYGYVGMSRGEIIQQNLFQSDKFQAGKEYEISFYFQFPGPASTNDVGLFTSDPLSNIQLKVFVATTSIDYDATPSCTNLDNWAGSDNYCEKDNNNRIEKATFDLSPSQYPIGNWHRLSARFTASSNYDWVGFEVQCDGRDGIGNHYIILDDFNLSEVCELGCTATSGQMSPIISTWTPSTFDCLGGQVTNIGNIQNIYMEVFDLSANLIKTQNFYRKNGFYGPVYWYGDVGNGGSFAAAGVYLIRITCTNDCGTSVFSNQVIYGGNCGYQQAFNPPDDNSSDILYRECCELNFVFNNKTFNILNSYTLEYNYKPKNDITITDCSFTNISKSTFKAGHEVIISGETSILPGLAVYNGQIPEFHALIEECPDAHRLLSNPHNNQNHTHSTQNQLIVNQPLKLNKLIESVKIFPNPTNGNIKINYLMRDALQINISLLSITGQQLFIQTFNVNEGFNESQIDMVSFSNGMFFLKITDEKGSLLEIEKIILNK